MNKNKTLKNNQKGQSPIVVFVIIVLIVVAGFTVWRLLSENSSKNNQTTNNSSKSNKKNSEKQETPKEKQKFSQKTIDYFNEVALGSEYGDTGPRVAKWEVASVALKVNGTPSASDAICLDKVIADFNAISTETKLYITKGSSNANIYFAPEAEFKNIISNYVPTNMGYFSVNWTGSRSITSASILISTTGINEVEKCHLIREETTQSMGIMKDSHSYSDSIFYDDWTYVNAYSEIDKDVIKLLYGGNGLKPNDDKDTVASKVIAI